MSTSGQELNARQQAFVREYAKEPNAKAAAIKAGYSKATARQIGSRLLTRVDIKSAIQARGKAALAKMEVTEARCLQELAAIAFSNVKAFSRWTPEGELEVLASEAIPDELAACIESVTEKVNKSENKDGSRKYVNVNRTIKLYPKLPALQLICEYLGMTDSMAPKITVRLITGIVRTPPALPAKGEQEAVTVEAEPSTD